MTETPVACIAATITTPNGNEYMGTGTGRVEEPVATDENTLKNDKNMYYVYTGGSCPDKFVTHAMIDKSVTVIEKAAFAGCTKLKYVEFVQLYGGGSDKNNGTGERIIDKQMALLTTIESKAFDGCHHLEYVKIPGSVKKIGDFAFRDCFQLKKVDFASSIPSSMDGTVKGNSENCCQDSSLEEIGDGAFVKCRSLTSFGEFPNSVQKIGRKAFLGCSSLSGELHLPPLLEEISPYTFCECSSLVAVHIPEQSIRRIGEGAFFYCRQLESIDLPDSINCIEHSAFYRCSSLTWVTLPTDMRAIEHDTFRESGLRNLYIHNGIEKIGMSACFKCRYLSEVNILSQNRSCSTGKEKNVSSSVKVIGDSSFAHCTSLQTMECLFQSVEEIGEDAFMGCSGIEHLKLPNSLRKIDLAAFMYCTKLATVILPESIKRIPQNAFSGCDTLRSVDIPSTVEIIASAAFSECSKLSAVNFLSRNGNGSGGSSLKEVQGRAFYGCNSLQHVELPDSVDEIGACAFGHCQKLQTVRLGNAIGQIDGGVFLVRNFYVNTVELKEISFSALPALLPDDREAEFEGRRAISATNVEAASTTSSPTTRLLIQEEGNGIVRIRFDEPPSEIAKKIRLYRFVCDFNRGGGLFLQRYRSGQEQRNCETQQTLNDEDKTDDDNNKSYPPSLWPMILSRLYTR